MLFIAVDSPMSVDELPEETDCCLIMVYRKESGKSSK